MTKTWVIKMHLCVPMPNMNSVSTYVMPFNFKLFIRRSHNHNFIELTAQILPNWRSNFPHIEECDKCSFMALTFTKHKLQCFKFLTCVTQKTHFYYLKIHSFPKHLQIHKKCERITNKRLTSACTNLWLKFICTINEQWKRTSQRNQSSFTSTRT